MYTIGEAATRSGVSVATLRAWERRYGVVHPARTESHYRLYDDEAIARLRRMRALVASGWRPREAAAQILAGRLIEDDGAAAGRIASGDRHSALSPRSTQLVEAAASFDHEALGGHLDAAFATLSFEVAMDGVIFPALREIGTRWASGELSVGAEHAASEAIRRRLAGMFEAAGRARRPDIVVGLPPGAQHELGALAFAAAAQRRGLGALYLGADVPVGSWALALDDSGAKAAVVCVPSAPDIDSAVETIDNLMASSPSAVTAVGGSSADAVAMRTGARLLAQEIGAAADEVRGLLGRR